MPCSMKDRIVKGLENEEKLNDIQSSIMRKFNSTVSSPALSFLLSVLS